MRIGFGVFLSMVISLTFLLAACNDGQGGKLGVVDMNRLMRDSAPGKAGLKFIESQQTELQGRLDALQDKLEKNPSDDAAMQELQKVYAAAQQKIQAEGQQVVTQLFDAIQKTLDSYRSQNGYAVLIRAEALDSYDPALDITGAVMAEVDKLRIDFKPGAQAGSGQEGDAGATSPDQKAAPAKEGAANANDSVQPGGQAGQTEK